MSLYMIYFRVSTVYIALTFLLSFAFSQSSFELASIFSDHMVLQQRKSVRIWGWGTPGQKVQLKASWPKAKGTATINEKNYWSITIPTPPAGGPFEMEIKSKDKIITLNDILIGEVWLCSGQSNMEWPLEKSENAEAEIAKSTHADIRLFTVPRKASTELEEKVEGDWQICTPETAKNFSAVAYYFGKNIQYDLDVPIGLIHSSWGGSAAEAWTSQEYLNRIPKFNPDSQQTASGVERTLSPNALPENKQASKLYNAMIHPLIPYQIKGVIWYQGEANRLEAKLYEKLFPLMIANWRDKWAIGDFPFYYVQIAPFKYQTPEVGAELRQAQLNSMITRNTGMVVTLDIGNPDDIHPIKKKQVGDRLALWALSQTYARENISYSGPLYTLMRQEGDSLRLYFEHTNGGLTAKDGTLALFEIAGEDSQFVSAEARIEGDTVIVHSDKVKNPKFVRYAWKNDAEASLFNGEGLPASPFHTGR